LIRKPDASHYETFLSLRLKKKKRTKKQKKEKEEKLNFSFLNTNFNKLKFAHTTKLEIFWKIFCKAKTTQLVLVVNLNEWLS
jgi:hypothetical protein